MQTWVRYLCENLLKSQNGLCAVFSKPKYVGREDLFFWMSVEHSLTQVMCHIYSSV